MNTTSHTDVNRRRRLIATVVAFIAGVVGTAVPIGRESAAAVGAGRGLVAHRAHFTSCEVGAAGALVETRLAEDQRLVDMAQRESARLDARTREAGSVKARARAVDVERGAVAEQVSTETGAVHVAGASSEQQAVELQRQLDLLHAKPTGHGLVLPPGDVLFTSGRADFKPAAMSSLNRLVNFLDKYPERGVAIHGYTDSLGSEEYNQGLSERRAASVRAYLVAQGIDSARLSASGMGQSALVAGGRQQSRRVELIISNPPVALAQRGRTTKMLVLLVLIESISGTSGRPLL